MKLKPFLLAGIILMMILIPMAYAYTDPGTGALLWQLLAAAFLGISFYFRRIVFWFKNKFKGKKDEN